MRSGLLGMDWTAGIYSGCSQLWFGFLLFLPTRLPFGSDVFPGLCVIYDGGYIYFLIYFIVSWEPLLELKRGA